LPDVRTQLFPRVALSEDALRQTLSGESSTGILRDLKNQLVHALTVSDLK